MAPLLVTLVLVPALVAGGGVYVTQRPGRQWRLLGAAALDTLNNISLGQCQLSCLQRTGCVSFNHFGEFGPCELFGVDICYSSGIYAAPGRRLELVPRRIVPTLCAAEFEVSTDTEARLTVSEQYSLQANRYLFSMSTSQVEAWRYTATSSSRVYLSYVNLLSTTTAYRYTIIIGGLAELPRAAFSAAEPFGDWSLATQVDSPGILSTTELRLFRIHFSPTQISVYRSNETTPLMSLAVTSAFTIRYDGPMMCCSDDNIEYRLVEYDSGWSHEGGFQWGVNML
ncbi:hypothetical protein FJT64_009301 [Amphibalanus amphitrite]|uniref:Apple domain-containing protein n=1 Tax=Amphibalanus amphitrite TaxID=1232801 RepID=A0A6A4VHS0_AMPAM|nr:hypothetical protein FJT64_009301 [Amphibalanus amphitrite]